MAVSCWACNATLVNCALKIDMQAVSAMQCDNWQGQARRQQSETKKIAWERKKPFQSLKNKPVVGTTNLMIPRLLFYQKLDGIENSVTKVKVYSDVPFDVGSLSQEMLRILRCSLNQGTTEATRNE